MIKNEQIKLESNVIFKLIIISIKYYNLKYQHLFKNKIFE